MAVIRELLAKLSINVSGRDQLTNAKSRLQEARRAAAQAQLALGSIRIKADPLPLIQTQQQLGKLALFAKQALGIQATPKLDTSAVRAKVRELKKQAAEAKAAFKSIKVVAAADQSERSRDIKKRATEVATEENPAIKAKLQAALTKAQVEADRAATAAKVQLSAATRRQAGAEAQLTTLLARVRNHTREASSANLTLAGRIRQATARLRSWIGVSRQAGPATQGMIGKIFTLGNAFRGLAIYAIGQQLAGFVGHTLDAADATAKLAAQVGVSAETWQVWSAFGEMAGATTEDLRITFKSLAKNIDTVAQAGKGAQADALKRLGVEFDGWKKDLPKVEDVLLQVGGALGELKSDTERTALAQTLLGEASLKIIPGFRGGTKAAAEQITKLKQLAIVYDKDFIANAEKAKDQLTLLRLQFEFLRAKLIAYILPAMQTTSDKLIPFFRRIAKSAEQSNILTAALALLGAKLARLGLSKVMQKLLSRFGQIPKHVTGIGRIIAKFGILRKGLLLAVRAVWKFLAPFLLFDDITTFLQGGDSAIGRFIDKLAGAGSAAKVLETLQGWAESLKQALLDLLGAADFQAVFSELGRNFMGFVNTMIAGLQVLVSILTGKPISGAVQDDLIAVADYWSGVWGDLKYVWNDFILFLHEQGLAFKNGLIQIWNDMLLWIGEKLVQSGEGWRIALSEFGAWLADMASQFGAWLASPFVDAWETIKAGAKAAIDYVGSLIDSILQRFGSVGKAAAALGKGDFSGVLNNLNAAVAGQGPTAENAAPAVANSTTNKSQVVNIYNNQRVNSTVNTSASNPKAVQGVAVKAAVETASQLSRPPAALARQAP